MNDKNLSQGFQALISRTEKPDDQTFLASIQKYLFRMQSLIQAGNQDDLDKVRALAESAEEETEALAGGLPAEALEQVHAEVAGGLTIAEWRIRLDEIRDHCISEEDVSFLNELDGLLEMLDEWQGP